MHDLWIRILIESFLVVSINFMINITETFWENAKDLFSSLFVILGLSGTILFTGLVYRFLNNNLSVLNNPKVFEIWSSLYGSMTT